MSQQVKVIYGSVVLQLPMFNQIRGDTCVYHKRGVSLVSIAANFYRGYMQKIFYEEDPDSGSSWIVDDLIRTRRRQLRPRQAERLRGPGKFP